MPKLTKRTIDATEPQATEFFLWDEGIPGFGLRVMPSGRKSFVVQFRAGRRARRMSLGPSTVLTCDQARTRAITIIAAVKNGEDGLSTRVGMAVRHGDAWRVRSVDSTESDLACFDGQDGRQVHLH